MLWIFVAFAAMHALTVAPLFPIDERAHVSYALDVSRGRLPTIDTDRAADLYPRVRSGPTWVANHPPLYYALVAAPLRLGVETGHEDGGLRAARLLTALVGAAVLPLAALAARWLMPGQPNAGLIAAMTAGFLTSVPHIFALVYNDALAVALSSATLVTGLSILLRGPTERRWLGLTALAAAAMLTRLSSAVPVAIALLAALAGALLEHPGRDPRLLLRAAIRPCLAGLVTVVAAGWFYVRNRHLYGDVSGLERLSVLFELEPLGSPWDRLSSVGFILDQHDQLWGRLAGGTYLRGAPQQLARAVSALSLIGLFVALGRTLRRRARLRPILAWGLLASTLPLLLYAIAQHDARGGGPHARYLFPGLVALGALNAAAYSALPSLVRRSLSVIVLGVVLALNVVALHQVLQRQTGRLAPGADTRPFHLEADALTLAGVPASGALLSLMVVAVLAAAAVLMVQLARR